MKHSLRVMGLVTAIAVTSAILPKASGQTQPAKSTPPVPTTQAQPQKNSGEKAKGAAKGAALGAVAGGARPRARSSEQAIAVARTGEPSERTSNTKGRACAYSTNDTDVGIIDVSSRLSASIASVGEHFLIQQWILLGIKPLKMKA